MNERVERWKQVVSVMRAELEAGLEAGVFDDWEPEDIALIKWACEETETLTGPTEKEEQ